MGNICASQHTVRNSHDTLSHKISVSQSHLDQKNSEKVPCGSRMSQQVRDLEHLVTSVKTYSSKKRGRRDVQLQVELSDKVSQSHSSEAHTPSHSQQHHTPSAPNAKESISQQRNTSISDITIVNGKRYLSTKDSYSVIENIIGLPDKANHQQQTSSSMYQNGGSTSTTTVSVMGEVPRARRSSLHTTRQSFNSLHSPAGDLDSPSTTQANALPFQEVLYRENPLNNASDAHAHKFINLNPILSQKLAASGSHRLASLRQSRSYDNLSPSTSSSGDSSLHSSIFGPDDNGTSGRHVSMKTTVRASFTADGKKMLNEYVILQKIGRGSYGKVKLVMDKTTKHRFAMKVCDRTVLQKMKRDKRGRPIKSTEMDNLKKEVAILKKVEHPNVVKLYEVIDDSSCDKLYMIFEYVERGAVLTLPSSDQTCDAFPEDVAKQYFRDLLMGLQYLHDHKIIHRDIKPENLLVDKNGRLKLTDFGVSIMFRGDDDLLKTSTGTPAFLPPEACRSGKYRGKPFDIWCTGVTLYVLLYGKVPFKGEGIMGTYTAILNQDPKLPSKINSDLKDLFSKLLEKRPSKRITLPELLEHPWVTNRGANPIKNEYHAQEISNDDIENAIAPGETLKLIDKFVLMSRLQNKFVKKLNATRDRMHKRDVTKNGSTLATHSTNNASPVGSGDGDTLSDADDDEDHEEGERDILLSETDAGLQSETTPPSTAIVS
mmetsp:Transcript_1295/g.4433  ORF Transcript_1295/g.4433 Transcript_1295/m.4433 type:complete len:714 (-) Transcript_1295:1555-3696(-)|eukprot:CAMPEP_0117451392 /NCGR_PEP_ID=MMETSP0759-20121206/8982_1 /TAXON_ID=63605 /ORGANISM="Percolomonas cosmopolitus, Strain WS" /LENGTH=713 /DNA_ID=CAMNT_0005243987 /DNA_START=1117 /DNA_END=3258 /DNA_ORIENTATION=-